MKILSLSFVIVYIILFYRLSFPQDNKIDINVKLDIDEINIKFTTGGAFDPSVIENLIASKEGDPFDFSTYLLDVERIKKFYFDNGFFDTKVDTDLVFNTADEEVVINFIITENSRYQYYEVKYNGLDSVAENVKKKIFNPSIQLITSGGFYSKDTLTLEVNRVLNILFNNGYATASSESPEILRYETNIDKLKNKVNITFSFFPKERYVFGSTKVVIKSKKYNIGKEAILRELTYSDDKIYNKSEIVNSELNLAKISILDNPRITIDRIDAENKKIYLVIDAVIGNKYNLTPEIFGYYFQNVFYIGPGLSFSDKYFFGGGRVLTTKARFYFHSVNDNRLEFTNSIYQPFLFNNRNISGNWNIGAVYRLDELVNVTQIKNSFGVGYDLPNYTYINRLSSNWDVENTRVTLKENLIVADTSFSKFDLNYFTSTIGFTAIHNSINNLQFPFKGYYQSYNLEESGLLGNLVRKFFNTTTLSYFKFTNFNSTYYNLSKREVNVSSVLATKISTGVIIEYGDNNFTFQGNVLSFDRVPTDTRFVCGGSSSIRGWGAKQLGIVEDKKVGGNFIIENTIEHRLRPFLKAQNSLIRELGFATFIDWGNVWSEIGKFKLNEIAVAAGGGIRYYTVVGAIRLDVGFKIYDPQPGPVGGSSWLFGKGAHFSDKYNLQFGIGNTF